MMMFRLITILAAWVASVLTAVGGEPLAANPIAANPIAGDTFASASSAAGWKNSHWKFSAQKTHRIVEPGLVYSVPGVARFGDGGAVEIRGIDNRDNPLRRELANPFVGDALYVRFLFRYRGRDIDQLDEDDGEFFVLWLDDIDGSDGATHSSNVPNIGLRVNESAATDRGKNLFMARFGTGLTAFSRVELQGDRTYLLIAKLSKSQSGFTAEFDRLSLWIDPQSTEEPRVADASVSARSFNSVRWVGFATGLKTEADDRIWIDEVALGTSWQSVFGGRLLTTGGTPGPAETPSPAETPPSKLVDFRRDVLPLLKSRCFECHQGEDAESSVRLDLFSEIAGERNGEPLAVAGASGQSRLIESVTRKDSDHRMPLGGPALSNEQIVLLKRWIDSGLPWDFDALPEETPTSDHWAFQPVERLATPAIADAAESANPIDRFIAAAQADAGVQPTPRAPRRVLIRRLTFDLTGLPPTPEEIEAFLADSAPDAYQRLVDRLLASPRYGQRWGRYWLDIARWAESNGYQHNNLRNHAWRYRDYVVHSFNSDKPYDEFLRQQVAGDELEPYSDENLIATGFLAGAQVSGNEMDESIRRNEILVDIANATAAALLGLTMECAQCHNHKFDPITARDYYRFQGFFVKGQLGNLVLRDANPPGAASPASQIQAWGFYAPSTSPARIQRRGLREIRYPLPYDPDQLAAARPRLLVRGDVDHPGFEVDPGWPRIFGTPADAVQLERRPRTALADWIVDPKNPLTSRVWINRLWQFHFGQGLVADASDFGTRTEKPLLAPLLDRLAIELIETGWSTKSIQRMIVTSHAYQRSAADVTENQHRDPGNTLFWRWQPRRLGAEAIRDSMLFVAARLNDQLDGPSVPVAEAAESQTAPALRRTLYLRQKRAELPRIQQIFDGTAALVHCSGRRISTVPLQPLYLLNSQFSSRQASALADRVTAAAPHDTARQVTLAFGWTLGREPDAEELERCVAFLDRPGGLAQFCHALLNLNEFVYVE